MYTKSIANVGTSAIITRRSALATEMSVPVSVNLTFSSRSFVMAIDGTRAGMLAADDAMVQTAIVNV